MYNRGIKPRVPKQRRYRQKHVKIMKIVTKTYRQRWVVERTFAWVQNFRRLVVRWDRSASMFNAFLIFALIVLCIGKLLK